MTAYTASTSEATATVTATATDDGATVALTVGGEAATLGESVALSEGENAIAVTVTNGEETKTYTVTLTYTAPEPPDATLSALTIGALTLTPTFDPDTTTYSVATSDATNKVTATATDDGATVSILNGSTPVTSGNSATWEPGENTLTITVTNGTETKTYTVTVTKS